MINKTLFWEGLVEGTSYLPDYPQKKYIELFAGGINGGLADELLPLGNIANWNQELNDKRNAFDDDLADQMIAAILAEDHAELGRIVSSYMLLYIECNAESFST